MPKPAADRERRCVVTREVRPERELIRFVAGPDGEAVPDLRRRLPGRGAWVTADRAHVAKAVKGRALQKALELSGPVAPDLADTVGGLLLAAAAGALSLARKAGGVVAGFAKVESAIAEGRAAALIHAGGAGEDGVKKLAAAVRRSTRPDVPVLRCFGARELDLAFGGSNVIHAALLDGRASVNVLDRVGDLVRYDMGCGSVPGVGNPNDEGDVSERRVGQNDECA